MKVTLTTAEMIMAGHIGIMRNASNSQGNGRMDAYGAEDGNPWGYHVLGAMGECAVAKAFNIYWNGSIGRYDADDVGPYQVRTRLRQHFRLILHPRDADEKKFVVVFGVGPVFEIRGWCFARTGKQKEYWQDPSGKGRWAYFVPDGVLNDMSTLLSAVYDDRAASSAPRSSQSQLFDDGYEDVSRDDIIP